MIRDRLLKWNSGVEDPAVCFFGGDVDQCGLGLLDEEAGEEFQCDLELYSLENGLLEIKVEFIVVISI